ncbi:MAG: DUF1573 domain-containing protein [Planctomycetota bacterium]|nr:DUF1573 domain-containing protein [Planctomycetota bacterium]
MQSAKWVLLAAVLGVASAYVIWGRQEPPPASPSPNPVDTKPAPPPPVDVTAQQAIVVPHDPDLPHEASNPDATTMRSRLLSEPPEIDFGVVDPESHHPFVFVLKNPTAKPIHIVEVRAGCGCVSVQPLDVVLEPGASCELKGSYHAKRERYSDHVSIGVVTDEGDNAVVAPAVKATVHHEIVLEPPAASFGMIRKGASQSITLAVKHFAGKPFRILSVGGDANEEIKITHRPKPGGPGDVHLVEVVFSAGARLGLIKGEYKIYTDNEKAREIPLSVIAGVQGDLIVQPLSIVAMRRLDGNVPRLEVYLRRVDNRPLALLDVKDSQGLEVAWKTTVEGVQIKLELNYPQPFPQDGRAYRGDLILKLEGLPDLRVPYIFSPPVDQKHGRPIVGKPKLPALGAP